MSPETFLFEPSISKIPIKILLDRMFAFVDQVSFIISIQDWELAFSDCAIILFASPVLLCSFASFIGYHPELLCKKERLLLIIKHF